MTPTNAVKIPEADKATIERNYKRRPAGFDGVTRCVVCQAPIKRGARIRSVRVVNYGGYAATREDADRIDAAIMAHQDVSCWGDIGEWPVGPECARKHHELDACLSDPYQN